LPASAVAPAVAANEAKHGASPPVAKSPAPRASKAKVVPSAATPEPPRPTFIAPAPAPAREPSKAAPAPTPSVNVEACKDKVFLSKELCLAEACETPGGRNHPMCVKWREDKALRQRN
jgi:hypothetical protein